MTAKADQIRSRRQAFAAPGSPLDRVVRWLALGLPALVGVVAALMIITPLSPRGEVSFLLDRNKVAIAEDRLRVDNAMYRGQDTSGRPFSLLAGEAVQKSASEPVVKMQDLVARLLLPDGPAVLRANAGRYNLDLDDVVVDGFINFSAADGYRMSASNVTINLATKTLQGDGLVEGTVPAGRFRADSLTADLAERTVALIGNARLRMTPGKMKMPAGTME
ncbi:LPS export ABC transporter periplasmic protein LptC [Altericroceibacterium endophyticum]|uniref:LPS export ABC transporter periplasmic protein LptC n=1 Tax=Altericroceibacterium endophyticum TaxID=1808508 RepID=A0A6I4T730_9SPHN|nr:LPS export ABC transporter periplasmic protein LptC [Altericroceibacterium endophyticum]MXO65813.1 LPS export ABC transporter periplasmic protein LptC [Altericroceibacterium endophyticum]